MLSALLAWDFVREADVVRRACLFRAADAQYFVHYDGARATRVSETVVLTVREARALYDRFRVHALERADAFPELATGDD